MDVRLCRNCSKARPNVSRQRRSLESPTLSCWIKKFGAPGLFTLGRGLRKFLQASSTTMESLPLKELDFGLQKRIGPSSGVVVVLVSPGLEWVWLKFVLLVWGVTCGSLVIEVQYLELDFEYFFGKLWKINISCSTHNFYINRMSISYTLIWLLKISISHFVIIL